MPAAIWRDANRELLDRAGDVAGEEDREEDGGGQREERGDAKAGQQREPGAGDGAVRDGEHEAAIGVIDAGGGAGAVGRRKLERGQRRRHEHEAFAGRARFWLPGDVAASGATAQGGVLRERERLADEVRATVDGHVAAAVSDHHAQAVAVGAVVDEVGDGLGDSVIGAEAALVAGILAEHLRGGGGYAVNLVLLLVVVAHEDEHRAGEHEGDGDDGNEGEDELALEAGEEAHGQASTAMR